MSELLAPFSDPEAVARYAEGPPRFVPGFADLHRMAALLLAERAPEDARVLVLGAGGGLELKAFAEKTNVPVATTLRVVAWPDAMVRLCGCVVIPGVLPKAKTAITDLAALMTTPWEAVVPLASPLQVTNL